MVGDGEVLQALGEPDRLCAAEVAVLAGLCAHLSTSSILAGLTPLSRCLKVFVTELKLFAPRRMLPKSGYCRGHVNMKSAVWPFLDDLGDRE